MGSGVWFIAYWDRVLLPLVIFFNLETDSMESQSVKTATGLSTHPHMWSRNMCESCWCSENHRTQDVSALWSISKDTTVILNRHGSSHTLKGTPTSMPGMSNQITWSTYRTSYESHTGRVIPIIRSFATFAALASNSLPQITFLPGFLLWLEKAYLQVDTNKPLHSDCEIRFMWEC